MKYRKTIFVEISDDISEDEIDIILDNVDFEIGDVESLNTDDIVVTVDNCWNV